MRPIAPASPSLCREGKAGASLGQVTRAPGHGCPDYGVEHGGVTDAAGAINADMVRASPSEQRSSGAFALFECGYRPFFLLAALHGAVLVPVWVAAVFGWVALPVEMEVSWHAHQMVYGFAATQTGTSTAPCRAASRKNKR